MLLSIFTLISSSQQRLMERLPNSLAGASGMDEDRVRTLLRLALREPPRKPKPAPDIEMAGPSCPVTARMVHSPNLYWAWQTKIMLMSLAWLAFLTGLLCYFLTPLLSDAGVELWPANAKKEVCARKYLVPRGATRFRG
jgi:hypothetical protein